MECLRKGLGRFCGVLKRKRAAWLLLAVALVALILLVALHPRGMCSYLVIGMDNYGSLDDIGRSDVMMLVQIDYSHAQVHAVTFARDMMVDDGEGNDVKINTIVRGRDEDTLVDVIERNFDVEIDGWFRVNFSSVIEIVDKLGGAQVELTAEEARYIDRNAGTYPDSPLAEGVCRLNGAQALTYARCRHLDNDFGRGARQGKLVQGLVRQTKQLSIPKIVDIFNSLTHAWRSSLSSAQQLALFTRALWLRGAKVTSVGVPFEGTYRYGNASVVANLEENRALLHEALGLAPAAPDAPAAP